MTRAEDSAHFYQSLCDLLERRINLIIARANGSARFGSRHFFGPVYDPKYDHQGPDAGGGRTCSKCRRVMRYDVRVCPSCGTISR